MAPKSCLLPVGCKDSDIVRLCATGCHARKVGPEMRERMLAVWVEPLNLGPMVSVPAEAGHYTYVHRDGVGAALYVGQTGGPIQRTQTHHRSASWWAEVWSIEWTRWPSKIAAEAAESRLIRELDPPHNVYGTPRHGRKRATA